MKRIAHFAVKSLLRVGTLACAFGALSVALVGGPPAAAQTATNSATAEAKLATVSFHGETYFHRWSQNGQHEFTPSGQADLKRWKDMVTVRVFEQVTNEAQFTGMVRATVANYKKVGVINRVMERPKKTPDGVDEVVVVATLRAGNIIEFVAARFLMRDGVGTLYVASHREYTDDQGIDSTLEGDYVKNKLGRVVNALAVWDGAPALDALRALPRS
jgi:hypothetical protein